MLPVEIKPKRCLEMLSYILSFRRKIPCPKFFSRTGALTGHSSWNQLFAWDKKQQFQYSNSDIIGGALWDPLYSSISYWSSGSSAGLQEVTEQRMCLLFLFEDFVRSSTKFAAFIFNLFERRTTHYESLKLSYLLLHCQLQHGFTSSPSTQALYSVEIALRVNLKNGSCTEISQWPRYETWSVWAEARL